MKWIEVIQLRSVDSVRERLDAKLQGLIDQVEKGGKKQVIMAYSRVLIDTDFSIHILHDSKKVEKGGSRLGIRIVTALKEFGLANHSIWVELQGK